MPSTDVSDSPRTDAERASQSSALVVIEAERGVLSVVGSERVSWLNGVVTCDAASVGPERAAFGLLLSKQGKIQTDFYALSDGERLLLAVAPGTVPVVRAELDRMLVMEDVELGDVSSELVALSLHGPRAFELARAAAARSGGIAGLLDLTGLGGAVLAVPRPHLGDVVADLETRGARSSESGDWPSVRVPHGVGVFGIDYGPGDNPHESSLERRAIAWNKGCYLGQEAVFMQDARGKVKRRLVVLHVRGAAPIPAGSVVMGPNGDEVGRVSSSAPASGTAEHFALAKLLAPAFEPGTELVVGGAPARVVARAFDAGAEHEAPTTRQTV